MTNASVTSNRQLQVRASIHLVLAEMPWVMEVPRIQLHCLYLQAMTTHLQGVKLQHLKLRLPVLTEFQVAAPRPDLPRPADHS